MFKLLIVDVDGVMTNATKIYDNNMQIVYKQFCDIDNTAIKRFRKDGVEVVILTADKFNLVLEDRRKIRVYYAEKQADGTRDKISLLYQIFEDYDVKPHEVAYVGDDILDVPIMLSVGTSYAPISAIKEVKDCATMVIQKTGSTGVLSDIYDIFKRAKLHIEDQKDINNIRHLCLGLLNQAGSGHPGMTLGAVPIMYSLFKYHLIHNPKDTNWLNKDRLVLSAGHGSLLYYLMLYLAGYPIKFSDLTKFRKYKETLSGHPECNRSFGIDVTTGVLGQGFANAVGMAIAAKHMSAKHKIDNFDPFDHKVYVVFGDGCMMEGITNESASLAGSLKLNNLIAIYDKNNTTIDGNIENIMNDDIVLKFQSMGWNVSYIGNVDNDINKLNHCITLAKNERYKPTLIIVNTTIGYGLHDANEKSSHCRKINSHEIYEFKANNDCSRIICTKDIEYNGRSQLKYKKWMADTSNMKFDKRQKEIDFSTMDKDSLSSTRDCHETGLLMISNGHPCFLGGSADLSKSTRSMFTEGKTFNDNNKENHICFGVREHAMAGICNGISAWAPFVASYCSTFMVFSDHMMPSIRLSALSRHKVLYFFTHDSFCGGLDGPTHQSIEHLNNLRNVRQLLVFRPANVRELIGSYKIAMEYDGPSVFVLSSIKPKYNVPRSSSYNGNSIIYFNCDNPRAVLISSGHDLSNVIDAANILLKKGICVRVISQPLMIPIESCEKNVPKIIIESASFPISLATNNTHYLGIDCPSNHGEPEDLFKQHRLNPNDIAESVQRIIDGEYI